MNDKLFYILIFIVLSACNSESEKLMNSETGRKPNRLINEKSPYLQQHAYNPVDWFPWGDEAFEKAASENKPIFLSIGYSTCHWCHVMEHESFEDSTVAALMNRYFVSIKVDREERPDIDQIYMKVCQLMTGHGGWPLTIMMTPEKKPFFAGTYFPKESRPGRIGLMDLLQQVKDAWVNKQKEIQNSANYITDHLNSLDSKSPGEMLRPEIFEKAFRDLSARFDPQHGGFGPAPKFPSPHNLMFLLRYWKRSGNFSALEMTEKTLREMRSGGVFDQVAFGFHRYSTDREWLVPHFEKMLYDQAMLALVYTETFQATGNYIYKITAEEILTYVLRDMTSPAGGFYSAEDADSEGEEGKFYVWSAEELRKILSDDYKFAADIFGIEESGNYIDEATRRKNGKNILRLTRTVGKAELQKFTRIRDKLFAVRKSRIHPSKDTKILTDWNGLMIAALAKAGRVFGEEKFTAAAEKAANFVSVELETDSGLFHRYMDGESGINGMLDDYAFFIFGLNELYESTHNAVYLSRAVQLNQKMLSEFNDDDNGGFFLSGDDTSDLITRTKEFYDGAIPSGNSVAMLNLIRLAKYTAEPELENAGWDLSKQFATDIEAHPTSATFFLCGLDFAFGPSKEIIITGNGRETDLFWEKLNKQFLPSKTTIQLDTKSKELLLKTASYLSEYPVESGKSQFFICENYVCQQPVQTAKQALELIK